MNQKESLMATRTSIKNKNKAKLGAAASLAAGGAVMGLDAGASSDPLGAYDNALLESAFRLLEEGQNQFLAAEDAPTQDSKRFKPEVNTAGAQAEAEPMVELHVAADVLECNAPGLSPLGHCLGNELEAIVQSNGLCCELNLDKFVQSADNPCRSQADVDLNAQAFPVLFIDHVECPEASA